MREGCFLWRETDLVRVASKRQRKRRNKYRPPVLHLKRQMQGQRQRNSEIEMEIKNEVRDTDRKAGSREGVLPP